MRSIQIAPRLRRILDFELAYKRVIKQRRQDLIPDIFYFEDRSNQGFESFYKGFKKRLSKYKASKILIVDIPKANFGLRPGVYLDFEDRVIVQAIVGKLAPIIDKRLSNEVFSFRTRKSPDSLDLFEDWGRQWRKFEAVPSELIRQGYTHCISSDVTAYFEHILHSKLKETILSLSYRRPIYKELTKLLCIIIDSWFQQGVGIPQGCDEMSFLGNLYLHPVDLKIRKIRGVKYQRWQDNIRIFSKDKVTLRKAIQVWITSLRDLGLNMASKKTNLMKTAGLIDPEGEILNKYEKIGSLTNPNEIDVTKVKRELVDLFNRSINNENVWQDRHYKYALYRIGALQDHFSVPELQAVKNQVVAKFDSFPASISQSINFLSLFARDLEIQNKLLEYLNSVKNIYDYHEGWILEYFLRCQIDQSITRKLATFCCTILRNKNKSWFAKSKAILLIGKINRVKYKKMIARQYAICNNQEKKAVLAALRNMNAWNRYRNKRGNSDIVTFLEKGGFNNFHFFKPKERIEAPIVS